MRDFPQVKLRKILPAGKISAKNHLLQPMILRECGIKGIMDSVVNSKRIIMADSIHPALCSDQMFFHGFEKFGVVSVSDYTTPTRYDLSGFNFSKFLNQIKVEDLEILKTNCSD